MKTSATVWFSWPPPSGHQRWGDVHIVRDNWTIAKSRCRILVDDDVRGTDRDLSEILRGYEPLDTATGLFYDLGKLPPNEDAIQAFANQYGPLTRGLLYVPKGVHRKFPKPPPTCNLAHRTKAPDKAEALVAETWAQRWTKLGAVVGDSFEYWTTNIRRLSVLIDLWNATKSGNNYRMGELVTTRKVETAFYVRLNQQEGLVQRDSILYGTDAPPTLRCAAEAVLMDHLNGEVADTAMLRLDTESPPAPRALTIVPRTLKDAIWLQFVLAVINSKSHRCCEVCGKPFELSPEFARTNRKLCSQACKARAHRKRREEATKLADQGVKPRAIAKRVGSQLKTVQNWLESQ